ncbi:ABC transporter ATP-binding protein [Actinobacteria bacterium YIM 96077]|uniref:ABC transporter ATP-binding protein n=1 Tax=Phytoactinopolyspora halophila TaxID=1981511 RepID=A0A329QYG2_9ACTN|nr:ABC transporter ATP-binding protein [Phytoactinopolyspora halophila]AYY15481.1 ABC transporter ATP-binding protein [Actinobacteria bacterium YIM 96077]RAW17420.1 ABC transporter ATP-binding protein [Phytoactinopolyspora halophila]
MPDPVLTLDAVSKEFGGLTAVDHVSLALSAGERVAVIGPNGAGKTTLFRMIAGEMRPSRGTISLFGRDVTRLSERKRALRGVARTFQVSNLFPSLTVEYNVRLAAQVGSWTSRRFWRRLDANDRFAVETRAVLEHVGLGDRAAHTVETLSHGEQRQLEIAIALMSRPRLILLDEPAAGLSVAERQVLRGLLKDLSTEVTYLLIEHDMSLALELADRVLCLDNGTPLACGTPDEIRADAAVQAVYLGRRDEVADG